MPSSSANEFNNRGWKDHAAGGASPFDRVEPTTNLQRIDADGEANEGLSLSSLFAELKFRTTTLSTKPWPVMEGRPPCRPSAHEACLNVHDLDCSKAANHLGPSRIEN